MPKANTTCLPSQMLDASPELTQVRFTSTLPLVTCELPYSSQQGAAVEHQEEMVLLMYYLSVALWKQQRRIFSS